jgi:starvation-inducible outer membrane lipoprotein
MKTLLILLSAIVLTGCMAAPPPVKIASHLLGRSAVKEAAGEITGKKDPNDPSVNIGD